MFIVLSLFGNIVRMEKAVIEKYAKEDPTFWAIWKVLLETQLCGSVASWCREKDSGNEEWQSQFPSSPGGDQWEVSDAGVSIISINAAEEVEDVVIVAGRIAERSLHKL